MPMTETAARAAERTRLLEGLAKWGVSDDTGASSKSIARAALGLKPPPHPDYPYDIADLGRCLRLLNAVPEARFGLTELGKVSRVWKALDERWDEIVRTANEEGPIATAKPDFNTRRDYPRTYALLMSARGVG